MCKQMLKHSISLPVGTNTHFVNADLVLTQLNCTLKILERQIGSVVVLEADLYTITAAWPWRNVV